jgi:hypothetical protein
MMLVMPEPLSEESLAAIEHRLAQVRTVAPPPWRGLLESREGTGGESCVQFSGGLHVDNEMYFTVMLGAKRLRSPDPQLDLIVDFVGNAADDIERLIAEVRRARGANTQ